MTNNLKPGRKSTLSELLLRIFPRFARPEAETGEHQRPPPARRTDAPRRPESVNPPHNLPKENLTADERARRAKEASRAYFKAAGKIEDFYQSYPGERPPGRDPERKLQRERGGRGGR
jgi:hypothetical protein